LLEASVGVATRTASAFTPEKPLHHFGAPTSQDAPTNLRVMIEFGVIQNLHYRVHRPSFRIVRTVH